MKKHHEKLGTESMPRLLFKQSMPAIIGMLMMSLYNVVDTIFIGQSVGGIGIAALAVSAPVQMVVIAIAMTIGIGAASIISRYLGAERHDEAEEILGNFFTLNILLGVIAAGLGFLFLEPLLIIFGATETILPYAVEYMDIILLGAVFLCFTAGSNNIIRAEGSAKFAMGVMLTSTAVNLVLDPILIFGFDMGLTGAAIATVVAQMSSAFAAFYYFFSGRNGVQVHFKNFVLRFKNVKQIFAIGSSSLARQSAGSVEQAILNHSLGFYGGDMAIAAFGIISRMFMVMFMPMFGLVQGMQPILGFNHGAKNNERAKRSILLTMKWSTIFSVCTFVVVMIFTRSLARIFTSDVELVDLTVHAIRIIMIAVPLIGFQVVSSGVYQALGKAKEALFLSVLRQLVLAVPLILIFPLFWKLDGLFTALPVADIIAAIITALLIRAEFKKLSSN